MNCCLRGIGCWLVLMSVPCSFAAAVRYHTLVGEQAGPSVMVLALPGHTGVAANEAAWQMTRMPITRGRVVVGCVGMPSPYERRAWQARTNDVSQLIAESPPDWVVVLSEDYDFHVAIPASYGSTVAVIRGGDRAQTAAQSLCQKLQSTATEDRTQWRHLKQVSDEIRNAIGFVPAAAERVLLVTTSAKDPRKQQHVALRTRQMRTAIHALLSKLDMLDGATESAAWCLPAKSNDLRIAIYDDAGSISSSGHGPAWIRESLRQVSSAVALVDGADVRTGVLAHADVVLFGGGSSSSQGRSLHAAGRSVVRQFVQDGGGYVGICAGMFLAMSSRDSYLGLIDAQPSGSSGSGVVPLEFSSSAREAIGVGGDQAIKFSGGPRIDPVQLPKTCEIWAVFADDLAREGKSTLELRGKAAVVAAPYGQGRVVVFSPHPERWPGPQLALWNALHWSAGQALPRERAVAAAGG